ncbi:Uncharacterised protein [Mycobacteroides abscessus subsp. abscessus]|nr:Uncharacterised protein [Mycobacteroides abscessus subsp. abscessus]
MSECMGPGRNREMSMIRSPTSRGCIFPISSRCPGDSIWKQPRVWVERISSKVSSSRVSMASRSGRWPSVCSISSRV